MCVTEEDLKKQSVKLNIYFVELNLDELKSQLSFHLYPEINFSADFKRTALDQYISQPKLTSHHQHYLCI